MAEFCAAFRAASGSLYAEIPRKTSYKYGIHNHYQITDSTGKQHTPIFSRSCQLRRVDDWKKEIVFIATPFTDEYLPVRDRIIILECVKKICLLQTTVIVFGLEQKYKILDTSTQTV